MANLHAMLQERLNPESDIEWSDIAQFMTEYGGSPVAKEYCRKGAPLYYLFSDYIDLNVDNAAQIEPESASPRAVTTTMSADGTIGSELKAYLSQQELHDADALLRLHGYDPEQFELVSSKASAWGPGNHPMYSSKIAVKPRAMTPNHANIETWFERLDRHYSVTTPAKNQMWGEGDKLLIIPISDLHFNMQATLLNSGNEYNCEIAEKLFEHIIADVLEQTSHYCFKKILFTIGGDMMDADSPANTTTKGTAQNCDKHYWDACEQMYAMTIKAIDALACRAPVDVMYVPGNHDNATGYRLAKYVDAWFRNDDRVSVDYSPLPRHYYVFGKTLFVFTHDCDVKRLQKLIPDEAREHWAKVNFTEVFLQHLHSEALLFEENNMRCQRLPSPVARSVWTNEKGYRAARQCKSFVYDENYGLRNVIYTVIPE